MIDWQNSRGCIEWPEVIFVNPCQLTTTITALANAIACGKTVDELNIIGVMLTQLGDTILTIATQKSICKWE